jgi:segregation and condensation protein B
MFEAPLQKPDVEGAIEALQQRYRQDEYSFELQEVAGGYQFTTKPAYAAGIGQLLKEQNKKRLSNSALETLAIVAYKQPVTKSEIEQIRGVSCDYALQKLLEKELIAIKGKAESIGRPLLYGTSPKFEKYFGLKSLKDLPTPKDFAQEDNKVGEEQ